MTIRLDGTLMLAHGWRVAALLREAGCKPLFSARHGAYMLDAHRLPDVLAYLESRHIAVEVVEDAVGGDVA